MPEFLIKELLWFLKDIPLLKMQLGSSKSALLCFPAPENMLCAKAYPSWGHKYVPELVGQ